MRQDQAGYLVLSRGLFVWGCAGGAMIGAVAALVGAIAVRPDAMELRNLALLIGFEIAALSVCLSMLLRVVGNAGQRLNDAPMASRQRLSDA